MHYPYAEIEFTSAGERHDPAQQEAALEMLRSADATDVLLVVHGWNNDMSAARRLYERLTDGVHAVADQVPGATQRRLAVIGVLWPSVRWADDDELAGGGVGLVDEASALREAIAASVDDPGTAARLEELVPQLEESAAARQRFLELLRDQLPETPEDDEEPPPSPLLRGDTEEVFDQAAMPDGDLGAPPAPGGGAAATGGAATLVGGTGTGLEDPVLDGGAAGLGFGLGGVLRGARTLLNLTTYYTMKARAGHVGARGVAGLLATLEDAFPDVRRHLAGHSFGARVVVAAVAEGTPVHTVMLLQGAFSHHGLAKNYDDKGNDGFFRRVLAPQPVVTGPVLVTHTGNDRAVGLAYAAASRLARQRASGIGGPNDLYGGIGRNGALKTPEVDASVDELHDVGDPYELVGGRVHNLRADRHIGSHSAVTGKEVGYALLHGMCSSP